MANNYVRTTITLPKELLKTLKKRIPKGKYSEYTAEALKEKLAKERSWNILEAKGSLEFSEGEPFFRPEEFFEKMDEEEEKEMEQLRKRKNG